MKAGFFNLEATYFVEIILSLQLIQVGQLSVTDGSMHTLSTG